MVAECLLNGVGAADFSVADENARMSTIDHRPWRSHLKCSAREYIRIRRLGRDDDAHLVSDADFRVRDLPFVYQDTRTQRKWISAKYRQ